MGGDGIGPEVVEVATRCLLALDLPIDVVMPPHGAAAARDLGSPYPEETRAAVESADAILFGAVDTGPEGFCRPILRHLRFGLDTYANLRPASTLSGLSSITGRKRTNLVIVRELSEDMYPGCEGDLQELAARWPGLTDRAGRPVPTAGKFALRVITESASRRIGRYAARLAAHRRQAGISAGHVTIVGKANVLRDTDGLFGKACEAELSAQGGLTWDTLYVDEAARRLVANPDSFDVIVTSNLFGDILSDVACEVMGGLPMSPSGSIGDRAAYFEPCHGSAPEIAGRGIANPSATILSAAMMLSFLGFGREAERLVRATIEASRGCHTTADRGGGATTQDFGDQVCCQLG
jgi:isocitrate/isopropylmalate dehydrogenase